MMTGKLNTKAMIRVEMMLKKPFSDLDYTSIDDVNTLLYCYVLSVNPLIPFDLFKIVLENEKKRNEIIEEIALLNSVSSVFAENSVSSDEDHSVWIKDIVPTLISEGIDSNYLLNEVGIMELPLLIKAAEIRRTDRLESGRLWTFFTVLPHLDKKSKIKKPEDLFPFPWEVQNRESAAIKNMEDNEEVFKSFMDGKFNHLIQK